MLPTVDFSAKRKEDVQSLLKKYNRAGVDDYGVWEYSRLTLGEMENILKDWKVEEVVAK